MIISRAPLRINLGGPATDGIPYSSRYGGFCISAKQNILDNRRNSVNLSQSSSY